MQHAVKDVSLQKQKPMHDSTITKQIVRPTPPNIQTPLRPASSVSTQTAQIQNVSLSNAKPVKVKAKQLTVKAGCSTQKPDNSASNFKNIQHHSHQGNTLQNK